MTAVGAPAEAARCLAETYGETSTIRTTPEEHRLLLSRIVEAFGAVGGAFQAGRFARKRQAECPGR